MRYRIESRGESCRNDLRSVCLQNLAVRTTPGSADVSSPMTDIVDISYGVGDQASYLAGAGIRTVIRYYSRDTGVPAKRLTLAEARALSRAGLSIGVVHESRHGDRLANFTEDLGILDAQYARGYAAGAIQQPSGSAIYFGADLDPSTKEVASNIVPYFKGVASVMRSAGAASYKIGVYGSGRTCASILDAGLADYAWLAQSTGWADYKDFKESGRWSLQQLPSTKIGEIECDENIAGLNGFGGFQLDASPIAHPALGTAVVIAKSGVRLRAGPGVEFDVLGTAPFGSTVHILKVVGDWTMVDLTGAGGADGFVNSHFIA